MIKKFFINNFKSLMDFEMPLSNFTCLIGLNSSGKSTVLQALDFLGALMRGTVQEWLAIRDWSPNDLRHKVRGSSSLIEFSVEFVHGTEVFLWSGIFNLKQLQCGTEQLVRNPTSTQPETLLHVRRNMLKLGNRESEPIRFGYHGSIFSQIRNEELAKNPALQDIKSFISGIKSLDLLAPHLIRKRAREGNDIGLGGEKLSAFLHGLDKAAQQDVLNEMQSFFPQLQRIETSTLGFGWKDLAFWERVPKEALIRKIRQRHMSDGMLRILAILAELHTAHRFVLFDEIENGIHPELADKLVTFLLEKSNNKQTVVTTHSPMILNYIPDDRARESIVLLYQTTKGQTKGVRFFDLPIPQEKLRMLGPGEVFADTYLEDVVRDLLTGEAAQ